MTRRIIRRISKMKFMFGRVALAITILSACAPVEAPIAAYTCGWQHPCSAQNPTPVAATPNSTFQKLDALPTPKDKMVYLLDKQKREGKFPEAEWDYLSEQTRRETQASFRQMCIEAERSAQLTTLKLLGCPTPEAKEMINRLNVQSMERESADIENSMRQIDQEQKMKDLEDRTNENMRRLEEERDREHMRYLDSESDR
jgi:hypothetical protein